MTWIMDSWELWQQTAARGFCIWGYFENGPWRAPLRGRAEGNPYGNTMRIFWNLNCPQTIFEHKCKELTPNAEEWIVGLYGLSRGRLLIHFGRGYSLGKDEGEFILDLGILICWILKWFEAFILCKYKKPALSSERWWVGLYGQAVFRMDNGHCPGHHPLKSMRPFVIVTSWTMRYSLQLFTATRSVYGARCQWSVWMLQCTANIEQKLFLLDRGEVRNLWVCIGMKWW